MTSDSAAMILTCPDCATSYYVPDSAVGQRGRKVRCATCGFAWKADPGELDDPLPAPPPGARKAAPEPELPEEDEIGAYQDYEEPEAEEPPEDHVQEEDEEPPIFVAPPPRPRFRLRLSVAAITAMAWTATAAAIAVIGALLLVYRAEVVRLWPPAAGTYARVGLPVNAVGLDFQEVSYRRLEQGGRPALVVTGVMRNVRAEPVSAPPLSIVLSDPKGRVLVTRRGLAAEAPLAAGTSRRFSVTLADPPARASAVDVTFVVGGPAVRAAPRP